MSEVAHLVWVVDWFDGPIEGLARRCEGGELVWFRGDPDEEVWTLYRLTAEEQAAESRAQRHFEAEVGTHWSFEVPVEELAQRPRERRKAYYAELDRDELQVRAAAYVDVSRAIGQVTGWANLRR
jgi:hypothetical protein